MGVTAVLQLGISEAIQIVKGEGMIEICSKGDAGGPYMAGSSQRTPSMAVVMAAISAPTFLPSEALPANRLAAERR